VKGSRAWIQIQLRSDPACLTVVRGMLAGLGEALDLDSELLDDMKTAISEACNNVVMHAYPDGAGPLRAVVQALSGSVEVVVSDRGRGMAAAAEGERGGGGIVAADEHMGLGLAVISALADRAEFHRRQGGGTGVRMSFARRPACDTGSLEPSTWSRTGSLEPPTYSWAPIEPCRHAPLDPLAHAELPWLADLAAPCELALSAPGTADGARAGSRLPPDDVCVVLSPPSLLTAVLGRTARALAATSSFSLDRFSDLYLITDELAAHAGALAVRRELAFALATRRGTLELSLAPLRTGASACISRARSGSLPLARLVDSLQVVSIGEGEEVLRALVAGR
jgi:serine/threonine-protein kinase RsbW